MERFLLVSSWAPPTPGGAPVILRRLLDSFPAGSYTVLTSAPLPAEGRLAAPHELFDMTTNRATAEASSVLHVTSGLHALTAQAIRLIERDGLGLVLATSGDPVFTVAAARAARATGRPLLVHLFDLLAGNRYSLARRVLAAREEREVLRQAARVFVPNEAMREHYRARAGVDATVVPNGVEIPPQAPRARPAAKPATVLYTGAVYWAQRDAVRDLVVALRALPDVRLEIKTQASTLSLFRVGLRRSDVGAAFTGPGQALAAQRDADVLFLPLSFGRRGRAVIETALPGKTAEYMVSGTPILVHAPPAAYVSRYARQASWGYVVDSREPAVLAGAIRRLVDESELRSKLVDAAFAEAARNLDIAAIAARYARYFEGVSATRP